MEREKKREEEEENLEFICRNTSGYPRRSSFLSPSLFLFLI